MPVNFRIPNHIVLPFGFTEKWNIDKIKVCGVSTDGTYFTSETKCAYINVETGEPLRLHQFKRFMPDANSTFPTIDDAFEAFEFLRLFLRENCALDTLAEKSFLDVYFQSVIEEHKRASLPLGRERYDPTQYGDWLFWALMPFPQAHIYVRDPFKNYHEQEYSPDNMYRVDFAFWTGQKLVAVEIDGASHIGNSKHVTKDRMLSRAGIPVIHVLNEEIGAHGIRVIDRLLPRQISSPYGVSPYGYFESNAEPQALKNPLSDEIPF